MEHSGAKYLRTIKDVRGRQCMVLDKASAQYVVAYIDYYSIEKACDIPKGGVSHAGKKIIYGGVRGKCSLLGDLKEARDALSREIAELEDSL